MSEPVDIGPLRVTSRRLPFEKAQPLIPTVGQLVSIAIEHLAPIFANGKIKATDDLFDPKVMLAAAPALRAISDFLAEDDRLDKFAPKILASTTVVMESSGGEKLNYELSKPKDRNDVFNAHPECYLMILFHAGRTTFARFFPVITPRGDGEQTPSP